MSKVWPLNKRFQDQQPHQDQGFGVHELGEEFTMTVDGYAFSLCLTDAKDGDLFLQLSCAELGLNVTDRPLAIGPMWDRITFGRNSIDIGVYSDGSINGINVGMRLKLQETEA